MSILTGTLRTMLKPFSKRCSEVTIVQTEIIWKRKDAQSAADTYECIHDTIYFFRKSSDYVFSKQYVPLVRKPPTLVYSRRNSPERPCE